MQEPCSSSGGWADLTADLTAYAGQTVTIGFRYWTDVAVANPGMFVDDIAVDGSSLDDAETDFGWDYNGFIRTGSVVTQSFFNAYFAEFRTYKGYDDGLRTGPYNFGFTNNRPWAIGSSTSPTRMGSWSGITTHHSQTTT